MDTHTTAEGQHVLDDGAKLHTKTWKPSGTVQAYMVVMHGFSDHSDMYPELFTTLASQGIEVRAFDQRGWGRSVTKPSEKGHTGPTTTVMADMTSFLSTIIPNRPVPAAPVFLYGHSMGGQETLIYAATGPAHIRQQIRGYLLEAPFVALHPKSRPNPVTVVVGRLAGKLLPHYHMYNPLDYSVISRDKEIQQAVKEDTLCHDTGTLEGLAGMLDRAADLESGKVKVGKDAGEGGKTRIWISHGTQDKVCSFEATKNLYESLDPAIEDKEFKVYDGWYHMLHRDLPEDRVKYADDVAKWILARLGPGTEPKSKL
ncbi:alpha/beta-hydrolase [Rhizodiscina lignyota]|uniref:Alpha/beta-hydrolase n=1 Tax=Rhizodiscina lignyota TaxID=1504668 RepID=A0A9P4M1N3_9PEZI|nr:alpha/beta-hydrolase [Rhizodiscina lignyota]